MTEIEQLKIDNEKLLAEVLQYRNTISWHTTCFSCARILDAAYADTMRAEEAEAEVQRLQMQIATLQADRLEWQIRMEKER